MLRRATRVRLALGLVVGLAVGLVGGPARAQQADLLDSPETRCLTVVSGAPDKPGYPVKMLSWKVDGEVTANLRFEAPDRLPGVELVADNDPHDQFRDAVKAHVRNLRVPCMVEGKPAVALRVRYLFRHDDRSVHWSVPQELNAPDRRRRLACVQHLGGKEVKPRYPAIGRRADSQGRAILRLTFTARDAPPRIEQFPAGRWNHSFSQSAADWAEGLRMPCHSGGEEQGVWSFVFMLEGTPSSTLKDLQLVEFLGMVKGIREQRASIDFNAMGCPFEVKLQYLRPHLPNRIGEVAAQSPTRRPLLEWLSGLELDLTPKEQAQLIGSETTLSVPCGTLQL